MLLRDGRTAHLRPIRPEDAELMVDFYSRVSDESKYFRFFSPMPTLSDKDVHRFTHVDHRDRVAFVVELGGQMIAVGRYDVVKPGEAEVAFLVEDRHQGRGIAQLLLEHLAQAGRERGVERFVAEVLPDNQKMIRHLPRRRLPRRQRLRGRRHDARVPHRPDRHLGRRDGARASTAPRPPRSTGSSTRARSPWSARAAARTPIGPALVRNLVTGNFTGRVYAVNPSSEAVSGLPAYASVNDIPDDVDVAIVAVPAEAVQDVVLDCAAKGVHGLVVISSGFAETGEEGRQRQRRLVGPRPLLRAAPDRPELPRRHQHRPGDLAQRLALVADAARWPGRLLLPVRRAGLGDPREGQQPWPRPLHVRQRRQPRRRLRQRPPAVLGGGRRHRGGAALPRVDRQPAQVLPDRPPGLAAQADHRGAVRPHHPGRPDGADGAQDRGSARRRSTRCSARPA